MADPILTDIFKTQVVFFGNSGLPEDVFVNNWYFRNDTPLVAPDGAIKRVLDSFYTGTPATGGQVGSFISSNVASPFEYRIYDLGEPPPRTRRVQAAAPLPNRTFAPLPAEVALTMSFFAGRNLPRNRGRIYLGPFGVNALANVNLRPNVQATLIAGIADRASNVGRTTENVTWVMVTRGGTKAPLDPPGAKVITAGWVDDGWDTVRRRGLAPTTRSPFSAT